MNGSTTMEGVASISHTKGEEESQKDVNSQCRKKPPTQNRKTKLKKKKRAKKMELRKAKRIEQGKAAAAKAAAEQAAVASKAAGEPTRPRCLRDLPSRRAAAAQREQARFKTQ
ncbi:uncharacterized protein LOC117652402 [Thrips palmi]|uniref:Uncharacterized protein LOC117652402 n=1 Tax=Thrips palmi TaxID=161013 RepID=A0A6P9AAU0_THRPL|nr:uncharacterized protein LOC117652402 [Thrips palmi]